MEFQVSALQLDLSLLARRVLKVEAELNMLQLEQDIPPRLRALEDKWARASEMLQSVTTTNRRLAQLALASEKKAAQEVHCTPAVQAQVAVSPEGGSEGLQALAMLDQIMGGRLEALNQQLADLQVMVEKQEQVSGCKNVADDNVQDMALFAAVKAEVQAQLADALNKGLSANESSDSVEAAPGGHTSPTPPEMSRGHIANAASHEAEVVRQTSPQSAFSALSKEFTTEQQDIAINRSTWEVVAFVGSPQYSKTASSVVVMILLLNTIVQLLFCAAANLSLIGSDFDETKQAEYTQWRVSAHRLEFVDYISGETLVQRVCDLDGSLSIATQQYIVKDQIELYLLTSPLTLGIPAGTLVCMFALMIWYLRVSAEFRVAYNFIKAVTHVPSGRFEVKTMTDGRCELTHLDASRKIACLMASLIRVSIALVLMYTGTLSIATTSYVSELLLNALALEVILNMDEYIFDTMIPKHVQDLVDNLKPLPIPSRELLGLGGQTLFSLLVVPAALLTAYFLHVEPHQVAVREVNKILCSGNKDFAYSTDANGFQHATANLGFTFEGIDEERIIQWEHDAVKRAAFDAVTETSASNMIIWQGDIQALDKVIAFTEISDLLNSFQPTCQDLLVFRACNDSKVCPPNAPESFQRFFTIRKGATITDCSQLAEAGDCRLYSPTITSKVDNAIITRGVCPEACGCQLSPPSPFRNIDCPTACTVEEDNKKECKDVPPQQIQAMRQLEFLQNDLQAIKEAEAILFLSEDFKILGCDLVAVWQDPYSNHTIPPCSRQASAASLLSCLTVRCHDYDHEFCQDALHEKSCEASMSRKKLPEGFPFTFEDELLISRICPRTCQACVELPYCIVPYTSSRVQLRLRWHEYFAIFGTGSPTSKLGVNWSLLLRSLCPSTCHCDTNFADGCPAICAPTCNEYFDDSEGGNDYRGCQSFTRSGRLCQKWSEQYPQEHSVMEKYNESHGIGDHNYCRNPDGEGTIWCYTRDPLRRWDFCDPL